MYLEVQIKDIIIIIIIERTKAGLESAKLRGKVLGRRKGLTIKGEENAILCAYHFNEGILSIPNILKKVEVSKATYYKYLELKGLKGKVKPYKKTNHQE
ncbi:hypothetical protein [Maribacter sp. Hel_I_7]|uniref:hypothetical protein n=1 Tax=Maribacter sp. Hel_I_7 TaxID=1249997 RepID=UPI000690EBA0|nr:hypothetical protein [Maribacter sp. Hel_I_7]